MRQRHHHLFRDHPGADQKRTREGRHCADGASTLQTALGKRPLRRERSSVHASVLAWIAWYALSVEGRAEEEIECRDSFADDAHVIVVIEMAKEHRCKPV